MKSTATGQYDEEEKGASGDSENDERFKGVGGDLVGEFRDSGLRSTRGLRRRLPKHVRCSRRRATSVGLVMKLYQQRRG
ncbi:hypothetical protein ACLB2K_004830 [Fragaria x ananassa]